MAYTPDPTDVTNPLDTIDSSTAAAEFRALKGYLSTLVGGSGFPAVNIFRKNAIIGGDFDTNPFQRGITFVAAANNQYVADRWKYIKTGTMIETIGQVADVPLLGANLKNRVMDMFAIDSLQSIVTTAEPALGVADISRLSHFVEGYNFKLLAQIPIVLSFWHKHTLVGTYCVALRNSGTDRSYIAEYTQAVSNVWEYESIAIPASPAAGTWNYGNGIGLEISFVRGAGFNFQTPAGLWTVGNFLSSPNQVNSLATNGNLFSIDFVQLEVGSIGSRFERRSFQEELVLCQRYYEKTFIQGITPVQNAGNNTGELCFRPAIAAVNSNTFWWVYKVTKRINSNTIFTFNPLAANIQWRDTTAGADRTVSFEANTDHGTAFGISSIPVAGNFCRIHATVDAEF